MKNRNILILITVGALVSCLIANSNNLFGKDINGKTDKKLTAKDELQIQDFQIAGLYLEQPISDAVKILGKPTKVETIPNGFNGCDEYDYYFPGITIIISEFGQSVFQMRLENKNLKTFRGIGIGDKEEDVYINYGKIQKLGKGILSYKMLVDKELTLYHSLDFHINDGKVSKIMIYSIAET